MLIHSRVEFFKINFEKPEKIRIKFLTLDKIYISNLSKSLKYVETLSIKFLLIDWLIKLIQLKRAFFRKKSMLACQIKAHVWNFLNFIWAEQWTVIPWRLGSLTASPKRRRAIRATTFPTFVARRCFAPFEVPPISKCQMTASLRHVWKRKLTRFGWRSMTFLEGSCVLHQFRWSVHSWINLFA